MSYNWLVNRKSRSVDQLRLWSENPRLNPEDTHITLSDYASDLIEETGGKESFLKLVSSIVEDGFVPADPIVVWKDEDTSKLYVAEGNRRVLALKLLRNPAKAPRALRSFFRKCSLSIDLDDFRKIPVCIAPSFGDCEWYINQRHASSTILRPWSRHQQQRWIAELYDKHRGNVDRVLAITKLTHSQINSTLRILKIRDLALEKDVLGQLEDGDQQSIRSHRLPMTILERWFENAIVKERWGIEFDDDRVDIRSDKVTFSNAYAEWIKLVLRRDERDVPVRINTRTITSNLEEIFECLPRVSLEPQAPLEDSVSNESDERNSENEECTDAKNNESNSVNDTKAKEPDKNNPARSRLVVKDYQLHTENHKMFALFEELKEIPLVKYKHCVAASIRVFLDISVQEYIDQEGLSSDLQAQYKGASDRINLSQKLSFLKERKLSSHRQPKKVVSKLLNPTSRYSLDILNSYVHGSDTNHVDKNYLNGFWDFLFPLLSFILDIKE